MAYNRGMRWCSVLSHARSAEAATAEVAQQIQAELGAQQPDIVWIFASAAFSNAYDVVQSILSEVFPDVLIVGCSGGGVLAAGTEVEHQQPALAASAAALPGVQTTVRYLETPQFPADDDAEGWHRYLGVEPDTNLAFILLPDPFTCDVEHLMRGLDHSYPDAPKVGGLVSGGQKPGDHALFFDGTRRNSGAVAVVLQGDLSVQTVVAQGCRPVGEPMLVTKCRDNVVLELNQRRPIEILRELATSLPESATSRHGFFLGIEMRDQREYQPGDFLIRNVLGIEKSSGGLAVGAAIRQFQAVQFHVFDRAGAIMDLVSQLERQAAEHGPARGVLLFSCLGRGQGLFNEPNHDSEKIRKYLDAPGLAGFFCNGEIGPVGGQTFLHGYTSALAVFRPATGSSVK